GKPRSTTSGAAGSKGISLLSLVCNPHFFA
ncbi:MAG: hypothetical protein ACI9KS_002593, partial [Sulfitobacter sp.]